MIANTANAHFALELQVMLLDSVCSGMLDSLWRGSSNSRLTLLGFMLRDDGRMPHFEDHPKRGPDTHLRGMPCIIIMCSVIIWPIIWSMSF